jgi:regulator of protease activity HflC (stomatin/prohibitin superfamily)
MRIVVREWERVLRYRDGRFTELLPPGVHWRGRFHAQHVRVDLRPRLVAVPGQEVLTSDGLSVKVSLLARCRISDARAWHETVARPDDFVYATLQIAVREAVASRTLDELLAARAELGPGLAEAATATATEVGLTLDEVKVRDLMVPAELRRAATEAATARAQGQAALERARSEVAATRALANAAKLAAGNPALLQLRTLQAVEAGRATVILSPAPHDGSRSDG